MKKTLLALTFVVALFTFGSCCNKSCEPVKKEIGLQLYSVRELIGNPEKYAANHDTVFKALASYGYTYVEATNFDSKNFYGVSPEQFKEDLAAAGLRAISAHTCLGMSEEAYKTGDFTKEMEWWDNAIAAHKAAGMKFIVAPGFKMPADSAEMKRTADYFNAIGKKCAEAGMAFGYHNHSHEFVKVGNDVFYDYLIENTDPNYVFFEMDVYWAVMAKQSPVDYFNKYPGRFKVLHIKDRHEIGQSGMVGFDAIYGAAEAAGLKAYIVELEGCLAPNILEGLKISADYLKKADFVATKYCKCCSGECEGNQQ